MNAIEIKNLSKNFGSKQAVCGLDMTVPMGAIYGFIGENGSGKSTTMKLICGHLVPNSGEIKLFGRDYTDPGVRVRVGALIENAGCFPGSSVYQNLMMQCINLGIENADEEIRRVLEIVRMEDNANIKFKSCSLGMKQRIGIAMALLGDPTLLILDEPINGLDTDGMRIMREILVDITKKYGCTVLISSHILGELEKIATHYGIVRGGKMICEMTAAELEDLYDLALGVLDAEICGLEHHIIPYCQTGKASGGFDEHAYFGAHVGVGAVAAVELDRAAAFVDQTADYLLGGGFSASVLTDKAVYRALGNRHIEPCEGLLRPEVFREISYFNCIHFCYLQSINVAL